MLSTNAFFFSRSANSRLDVKFPVTEKACDSALSFAGVMGACHGSSPQIPNAPVYGDCETPLAPSRCGRFQWMRLHDPVTDVDHLNVLFDDDVAGKRAVINPITQAALG